MNLESINDRNLRAFASTYRSRVLSIMVLPDRNVVDKRQMSISAGRALLTRRRCDLGRRHILCNGSRRRDLFDLS